MWAWKRYWKVFKFDQCISIFLFVNFSTSLDIFRIKFSVRKLTRNEKVVERRKNYADVTILKNQWRFFSDAPKKCLHFHFHWIINSSVTIFRGGPNGPLAERSPRALSTDHRFLKTASHKTEMLCTLCSAEPTCLLNLYLEQLITDDPCVSPTPSPLLPSLAS